MADSNIELKVSADVASAVKALDNVDRQVSGLGDTVKKTTGVLTKVRNAITIAFAVDKVLDFGRVLLETTAKLQATDAQFSQVFKGDEGVVALQKINAQADLLNINADRLKGAWSSINSQFKGGGMDASTALDATIRATQASADASAFYDMSLETSTAMLQSFMKGNFEAGDAIGVFTSAKQMDARATEKYGLKWQELNEAQRQWLLLDTVEKTYAQNGATGQAVREQNNWANVTANLTATWNRFLETVGSPVLTAVIGVVNNFTDVFAQLTQYVQNNTFSQFIESAGGVGDIISALVNLFLSMKVGVVDMITTVVAVVQEWYNKNKETVDGITQTIVGFIAQIRDIFMNFVTIVKWLWETFGSFILDIVVFYLSTVFAYIGAVLDIIGGIFKIFASLIKGDWEGVWEGIKSVLSGALTFLYTLIVKQLLGNVIGVIGKFGASIWKWFDDIFSTVVLKVAYFIDDVIAKFTGMGSSAGSVFAKMLNAVTNVFASIGKVISDAIWGAVKAVENGVKSIGDFFKNMNFKFPKISLPHFKFTGKLDLTPPDLSLPSIGIDWYAKGGLFQSPSVIGVGEAGTEAVLPLTNSNTMGMISKAIVANMPEGTGKNSEGSGDVVINMYGTVVREEADIDKVAVLLQKKTEQARRAKGRNA